MFTQRRVEIKKEFDSQAVAAAFAAGIEFAGSRDIRVKRFEQIENTYVVVLEKTERSKV